MDDAELVRRLRNMNEYEPLGLDGWEAADRIEAIIAERDAARDAALEEAAEVAESMADTEANMNKVWRNGCRDAAAAIRALKGKSHE